MDKVHVVLVKTWLYILCFCVDNSSSSHKDNWQNNFLVLGGGWTDDTYYGTGTVEKKLVLTWRNFFVYICIYLISKFKVMDNISWSKFFLGSIEKDFTKDKLNSISLNCTAYYFSVDCSSI